MSSGTAVKRWYEEDPLVHLVMNQMEKFPSELRQAVCRVVMRWAKEHLTYGREEYTGLKQLGRDKITSLMMSKQKRRWYDEDPASHQVFSTLSILDYEQRHLMAEQLIHYMKIALEYCQLHLNPLAPTQKINTYELERHLTRNPAGYLHSVRTKSSSNEPISEDIEAALLAQLDNASSAGAGIASQAQEVNDILDSIEIAEGNAREATPAEAQEASSPSSPLPDSEETLKQTPE